MILKALYDYYQRCDDLPVFGMEEKEIGFLIVIDKSGRFIRFEDCRIDNTTAKTYLVKKHIGRSSALTANYLYDSSAYVLGYSDKDNERSQRYFDVFREKIHSIKKAYPDNEDVDALEKFYSQGRDFIFQEIQKDPLWENISKNLSKKYSTFSFRINGDIKIIAQKKEILQLEDNISKKINKNVCIITGLYEKTVDTTTATMIPGSQATAKLVAFQIKSGYDSYGKQQGNNANISEKAEFAYTTALNAMLSKTSHNRFTIGSRTFLFWASTNNKASIEAEKSLFDLLGSKDVNDEDPNIKIEQVKKVFKSIYSGVLNTSLDDRFYILGLAPNVARISVVYWSETSLCEFAGMIIKHLDDMRVIDNRREKKIYMGLKEMLGAVTLSGKQSDATPNLPDAVVRSIFQGMPYPYTLFSSCIRRIRAEQDVTPFRNPCRVAILKAYLNRINDNNKKIEVMLDKENSNQGYLCGRLFAILDKIQEDANNISSIRERYMNAASTTPSSVFATILNLSSHHSEKLNVGRKIFYEKQKQEIIDKMSSKGFPSHLDLQDQGRFFVGYYHQRQDLFKSKDNE